MLTWSLTRFFSASARWARLATIRKRRRGFLTTETADLHRRRASSEGCLGWTWKFSLRYFSIALYTLTKLHKHSLIFYYHYYCLGIVWGRRRNFQWSPKMAGTRDRYNCHETCLLFFLLILPRTWFLREPNRMKFYCTIYLIKIKIILNTIFTLYIIIIIFSHFYFYTFE